MKHFNNKARQAGMTLIELTVVLLVLIGLAGLMIPYVSGFITRTHNSTGTNNLAALNNNIQRFQSQFMSLPDDLHTLVEDSGGTGVIYQALMNPNMLTATTYTADGAMGVGSSSNEISLFSLRSVGLTSFYDMKNSSTNLSKTFDAGNLPVAVPNPMMPVTTSIDLAIVQSGAATDIEAHLAEAFGMQATEFNAICNDYIVTGVGQESQLIGRTMADAPIHFAQNGDMGPNNRYNRFVAVFEVDKANGSTTVADPQSANTGTPQDCGETTHQARFIGSAMIMMDNRLRGLAYEMNRTYADLAAQ